MPLLTIPDLAAATAAYEAARARCAETERWYLAAWDALAADLAPGQMLGYDAATDTVTLTPRTPQPASFDPYTEAYHADRAACREALAAAYRVAAAGPNPEDDPLWLRELAEDLRG